MTRLLVRAQVLPLVSGIFIEVFGIPKMTMLLISLACIGQLLFTIGTYYSVRCVMVPLSLPCALFADVAASSVCAGFLRAVLVRYACWPSAVWRGL